MDPDEKSCPFCAETIKQAAVVCKHCRRDIAADKQENIPSDYTDVTTNATLRPLIPAILFSVLIGVALNDSRYGIFAALISVIYVVGNNIGRHIILTSKQVIYKQGIIGTHTVEIQLDKLESITVSKGIWGGFFGYGNVIVGGGGIIRTPSPCIRRPEELRNEIIRRSESVKNVARR